MYPKCYKNSNECCTFLILGILGHRCSTEKVSHFAKVEEPKVNICKHKSTNYVNIKLGVSFLTNQTSVLRQVFIVLGMYIFGSNYKRSSFLDLWQQLCWQVSPKEQSHDNINADSLRLSLLHVDLICLEPEMRHCTSYYWLRLLRLACWTKPGKQDSNNSLSAVGMKYRRRRKRGHSSIVILFVNFSPGIPKVYLSDSIHIDITLSPRSPG
jgi:hypothetical protein